MLEEKRQQGFSHFAVQLVLGDGVWSGETSAILEDFILELQNLPVESKPGNEKEMTWLIEHAIFKVLESNGVNQSTFIKIKKRFDQSVNSAINTS